MNTTKKTIAAAVITLCCIGGTYTSCTCSTADTQPLVGTIDAPLGADSAPEHVAQAIETATLLHQYEIMNDTVSAVSVWAIGEADETPTEGYGIVVVKGHTSTTFTHIRNTRKPLARYDAASGNLWLTTSAIEGTGVEVERLYLLRFDEADSAYIAHTIDPYDMQQALLSRLSYTIAGPAVMLCDSTHTISIANSSTSDMGGFDSEQPLWIGEQLTYDISTPTPCVLVTPGVKYTTGLVLNYDDMPTLSAPITIAADGTFTLGEITVATHPYEGTYRDEDNDEPNLYISYRRSDGRYDITLGIFRLTTLDDGLGTEFDDHLDFTATDAAGNPIGGRITLSGDTAVVEFTRSTWPLLENGSKFVYVR